MLRHTVNHNSVVKSSLKHALQTATPEKKREAVDLLKATAHVALMRNKAKEMMTENKLAAIELLKRTEEESKVAQSTAENLKDLKKRSALQNLSAAVDTVGKKKLLEALQHLETANVAEHKLNSVLRKDDNLQKQRVEFDETSSKQDKDKLSLMTAETAHLKKEEKLETKRYNFADKRLVYTHNQVELLKAENAHLKAMLKANMYITKAVGDS